MLHFDCPKLFSFYNLCFCWGFFFCENSLLQHNCKHCPVAKAPFTVASVGAVVIGTVLQCWCKRVFGFGFFKKENCQASKKKNVPTFKGIMQVINVCMQNPVFGLVVSSFFLHTKK